MFKKLSGLALAGTLILVSGVAQANGNAPSWFSAAASGQFDVAGVVSARCAVEVTDLSTTLDLQTGETGAQVAIIKESCNSGSGYTVSFSSANGGDMVHETDSLLKVDYSFNYDTVAGQDLAGGVTLSRAGLEFHRTHAVTIDVEGDYERQAGNYADIVTVTIAAN